VLRHSHAASHGTTLSLPGRPKHNHQEDPAWSSLQSRLLCALRAAHRASERGRGRAQRRGGLRFRLPRQDERAAGLQDAGLGRCDLAQAAAQRGLPARTSCRRRASLQSMMQSARQLLPSGLQ